MNQVRDRPLHFIALRAAKIPRTGMMPSPTPTWLSLFWKLLRSFICTLYSRGPASRIDRTTSAPARAVCPTSMQHPMQKKKKARILLSLPARHDCLLANLERRQVLFKNLHHFSGLDVDSRRLNHVAPSLAISILEWRMLARNDCLSGPSDRQRSFSPRITRIYKALSDQGPIS